MERFRGAFVACGTQFRPPAANSALPPWYCAFIRSDLPCEMCPDPDRGRAGSGLLCTCPVLFRLMVTEQ